MCESIESYANERAEYARIDECIDNCIHFNQTKDETIKYVTSKFEKVSDDYILNELHFSGIRRKENKTTQQGSFLQKMLTNNENCIYLHYGI